MLGLPQEPILLSWRCTGCQDAQDDKRKFYLEATNFKASESQNTIFV